jgi:hypothetical protein
VAVNVTLVPEQIAPAGTAAILTLTGNETFTDIVKIFEVAGLPVAHGDALDVNTQVTRSPLVKAAFE